MCFIAIALHTLHALLPLPLSPCTLLLLPLVPHHHCPMCLVVVTPCALSLLLYISLLSLCTSSLLLFALLVLPHAPYWCCPMHLISVTHVPHCCCPVCLVIVSLHTSLLLPHTPHCHCLVHLVAMYLTASFSRCHGLKWLVIWDGM